MPTHYKQQLVLVDEKDNFLGLGEKLHKIPVPLHRAISIVIFNKEKTKILITQRASRKETWPGFWSNAVCSHPYHQEPYSKTAERRLFEELSFKTKLTELFSFTYKADYDKSWGEHEYDVVFEGEYEGKIKPDPSEISDFRWIEIKRLKEEIKINPNKYTPWFKIILEKLNF